MYCGRYMQVVKERIWTDPALARADWRLPMGTAWLLPSLYRAPASCVRWSTRAAAIHRSLLQYSASPSLPQNASRLVPVYYVYGIP